MENFSSQLEKDMDKVVAANNKKIWEWIHKIRAKGVPIEEFFKQDDDGNTELTRVIQRGLESAAAWLIEAIGARSDLLDLPNSDVHTALHLSTLSGSSSVTRQLVLSGANAKLQTEDGNTPLHLACMSNDLDCLAALTSPFTPEELPALHEDTQNRPRPDFNLETKNCQGRYTATTRSPAVTGKLACT
ncbi:NF-kappa-B inhibitor cactus-like [Copidosoma floridanum]|uniref:NF-kappa-B inhibitor cactus-like n=1 Tax=Copidosoma floridanum TaxID=29053 RepID=UPI0006C99BB6|nr:NF-kappa-B inhibitor cactus-like [Copidosoma floridanum]